MDSLPPDLGIIIVDHGSQFEEANDMLLEVAESFKNTTGARIVEPAHMELAEPTASQAFTKCVEQGARRIVVHPYFLSPGRHSISDIPRLAAQAARNHPGITYCVTEPLGLDPGIGAVIRKRVEAVLRDGES